MSFNGAEALIPTLFVLVLAVKLKRAMEPLAIGSLVGYILLSGSDFASSFLDGVTKSLGDETVRWIIMVVGLCGSVIALLVKSGGATAFALLITRYVKNTTHALLVTWCLGLVIFIDDYLNALAVGSAMKKVTDKLKISREMLAYVVDTTAAPVCILLPFSTWAIYVSGLLESNGVAETGKGLLAYIHAIPYMFYAWIALLMPPLMAMGKLPLIGPMRQAELRAKSEQMSKDESLPANEKHIPSKSHAIDFILPMLSLMFFTWLFDVDILKGAATTLVLTILLFKVRGTLSIIQALDTSLDGIKGMVEVILILVMSFVLKDVNDQLNLTQYIIEGATAYITPLLLPVITFISLSAIAFFTGTFWGLYAVALPIMLPLAAAMNVDVHMMIGVVISAGAFGSHACFYSDSTVLSAKGSGCSPMSHALTQFPYALIAAGMTLVVIVIVSL